MDSKGEGQGQVQQSEICGWLVCCWYGRRAGESKKIIHTSKYEKEQGKVAMSAE